MTRLNELLGTEFPIVQGGMANIATAEFAAAVSNAGALGLIGGGGMDAAGFRESIRRCRTLTDRPFGVNIMLMHPQAEEMADIAAEERVAVITTGAGNPARFIPRWKESRAKVFPVVAAVALARLVEVIKDLTTEQKARRPTRPTRASKERRLASKAQKSSVKAMRGKVRSGRE